MRDDTIPDRPQRAETFAGGETVTMGRAIESDIVGRARACRASTPAEPDWAPVLLEDLRRTNGSYLNDERVLARWNCTTARPGEHRRGGLHLPRPDSTYRDGGPCPSWRSTSWPISCASTGAWRS